MTFRHLLGVVSGSRVGRSGCTNNLSENLDNYHSIPTAMPRIVDASTTEIAIQRKVLDTWL